MLKTGIIILILNNLLFGDYFISFDFTSINSKIISFHFNCTRAMVNNYSKKKFLFKFKTPYKDIEKICKLQKNKIIDNLLKEKFHINSFVLKRNNYIVSREKGVYLPKRFDIIIKNNYVYFYLKGEN